MYLRFGRSGVLAASITSLRSALSGVESIPRGHVRDVVVQTMNPTDLELTYQVVSDIATWWESVLRTCLPNTSSSFIVGSRNTFMHSKELAKSSAVLSTIEQD